MSTENIEQKEFAVLINNKNKEINHLLNIVNIINSRGGRVLTLYPPKILIALGNEKLIEEISQIENVTKVTSKEIQKPEQYNLDDDSLFVIKSWNLRNTDQFKSTKTRLAKQETKSWDFEFRAMKDIGLKGPGLGRSGCNVPVESVTKGISLAPLPRNTSMFFSGTVAVGLIIVNGPTGTTAEFTNAEITKVISETQEGTNNLIRLSPLASRLKFVFDIKQVGLSLNPASVTGEENWRDPAMNSIGYTSGSEGLYAYVNYLRKRRWCNLSVDWGYIAFFTKYPTSWFAYASIGGPRLVMQYANDGWGPDQIDRVYVHESGHIFGAPDEYSNSNCNTGGSWGYLGVSNCNCEVSNPSSIDCLMKGNTYNLCTCTIAHFGWRDTDGDKLPDPLDKISFSVKTFSPGAGYAIPNGLWLTGDFDGDGRDDIVHAVQNTNYVHPWLSRGDGTFDVKTFSPGAGYAIPNGLWLTGDFNGDGRDDIVHAVQNTNYVHPWLSRGDGTFDVKTFSPGAGYAIPNGLWLVGDFNGDCKKDILHAVQNTNYVHPWLSRGDGTFDVKTFSPGAGYAIPNGLWLVGDFNGDGRDDIVHAVQNTNYVHPWLSRGDGTFDVKTFSPGAGYAIPNGLWLVGDFNGDGRDDIVHAVQNTNYVHTWLSRGDGTFDVKTFSPGAGYAIPNGLWLVGDFNGDGRDDIVHAVQNTNYVHTWQSIGDGTFDVKTFSPGAGYAIPNGLWLVGDFDRDSRYDIVHAVQNTNYVHPWLSNGKG